MLRLRCYVNCSAISASKWKFLMIIVLFLFVAYPCHIAGISSRKPVAFQSNVRVMRASPINSDASGPYGARSRRLADPDPTSQPSGQPSGQPSNQPSCQPSNQPTGQPTRQPSHQPSGQPSGQPSNQPSAQPSGQPSNSPTNQPSQQPTKQPSNQPTIQPSGKPTAQPSNSPSSQPSAQPTNQPSGQPSGSPSSQPSAQPSNQPSSQPSRQPSNQPSSQPSATPTMQPSGQPSGQPSASPSSQPSGQPTMQPSAQPSAQPSMQPSAQPSHQPTGQPSSQPSQQPSAQPTGQPSSRPSGQPSQQPSHQPSAQPSSQPSQQPSQQPSMQPSSQPSSQPSGPSSQPTNQPSNQPTSQPSLQPSMQPSTQPTAQPSSQPSNQPSFQPSIQPSNSPTGQPTGQPSSQPSAQPSGRPSAQPSQQPSMQPTVQPSQQPSSQPTIQPTSVPTGQPSAMPSMQPSMQPTSRPTGQPSVQPSLQPSSQPSHQPSLQPSNQPTSRPSNQPTSQPSAQPSGQPSSHPSLQPTVQPSRQPSTQPSTQPSLQPSSQPSQQPSAQPTCQPSWQPSGQPTVQPSAQPSSQPSRQPTDQPSAQPSAQPSVQPTGKPTAQPSGLPSMQPSSQPSASPTGQPSAQPSSSPTVQPSVQPTSSPSKQPSGLPTAQPSMQPTGQPSTQPSMQPSRQPSVQPTSPPTGQPSSIPSSQPSRQPTMVPSGQPSAQPSSLPSSQPSEQPTMQPSVQPTTQPSSQPTAQPSSKPSAQPSTQPSSQPSSQPSKQPTIQPSMQPSVQPSVQPSAQPSMQPSAQPSAQPSIQPSGQPSVQPSVQPSCQPSTQPTIQPSNQPTSQPSIQPSSLPSTQPSSVPSMQPSAQPSSKPSAQPTCVPSMQPSRQPSAQPSMQPSTQPSSQPTNPTAQPSASPSTQPSSQPSFLLKVLRVELAMSSVFVEDSVLDGITVAWNELPSQAVQLAISFDPVNISSVGDFSLPYVYPSTFTLLSTSPGVGSQTFAVIGGTHVGLHRLKLALSGASIREFRASSEGFDSIRIVARGGFALAPLLLTAEFSFDGTSVAVTFDTPTNRGGYGTVFPCAALLVFPGASTARCQWTDNARIAIFPLYTSQSTAVLDVGSTIIVVDNTIRALCDLTVNTVTECEVFAPVSNITVLQVLAPGTPTKPTVALVVPSAVGACAELPVDISASAGAAGRPWLRGAFEVSASGAPEAAYMLQSYLNANYTTNRGILVPSTVLQRGVNYTIQIVMCNFLESCDFAAKTVRVSASSAVLPVVSVLGASPLSIFRTTTLTLSSNSFVQSCDGSVSRANLRYVWTIRRRSTPTGTFDTVVAAPSVSQDPTVYKLSSFTLMSGTSYQVILTVTSSIIGTSASDSVVVNVLASRLVARIASGLKQSVTVGTRIPLDGSSSTDPDVPVGGGNSGLLYQWTCSQRHPQFNPNCTVLLSNTVNAVVEVNAALDSINTTSRVTLTVFDASRSRSATTYTDIVVVAGTSNPVLRVSSPLSSLASVNTARTLALLGTVQTSVGCNAAWSVDDNTILLSKVAITSVTSRIPASITAVPTNLVLAAGVLPAGATFVFTLSCGNAATSIEVSTNSPPLPGEFAIAPLSGTELFTVFQFNALLWSDADLPVTYQFGFVVASSANTLIVSPRSLLSYVSTTLPAGGSNSGSASGVNCTLQVIDSLNAVSTSSKIVSVFSAAAVGNIQLARQQQVLALVSASTTMPASDATTDSITNLISVASAVMNDINCTAAPNCTTLSRSPCTRVENTCGVCLNGYIGDTGFKNTPCRLISNNVPVSNTTVAGECNSDIHCRSYQYCDIATHSCVSPLKSCNSNCSNQGSCIYLSTITGLPLTSRCGVDNTKCEAVCSCTEGYSGLSCEMDTSTLFVRRAVRSQLISSLQNLTLAQDINAETLSLWSSSLLSLALNPYELSVQDAVVASAIANKTLMYALSQGLDAYDDFVSVLQVTDTLASLQRYNYNPHDYMHLNGSSSTYYGPNSAINIVQVTSAFGELVVNNMQLGQDRVTYYYDNFRLDLHKQVLPGADLMYDPTIAPTAALTLLKSNTTLNNTDDAPQEMVYMPNITIVGPQTEFEILLGEPQTSAVVQPVLSTSATVGIKTLSVYPRAYTANTSSFFSTPLFVQMSGIDSFGNALRDTSDYISTIDFAFPFNAEMPVFALHPTVLNVTSNCTAERGPGRPGGYKIVEYYHTCPGSNAVILHNCTGILGTLVSYCPVLAPTCAHLSVSSAFITPLSKCTILEYNSTYTTCRCIVNATDTSSIDSRQGLGVSTTRAMVSRRLQNADQDVISADGTSNMVATASYISADRDDEFSPAFIVILPESNPKVYIVVYTLASLWGAALIVFCVFFYQHKKQSSKVKSMEVVKSDDACIESGSRMENAKALITEYVTAVIPLTFQQNLPAWKIVLSELTRHHRYFVLFSTHHRTASVYVRSAVLAKILTYTTWMMFLLAIFYHYQSPKDDNECDTYATQSTCVHEKRMFDPIQSVCSWNYHAHLFMHTCDYKEKYTLPTGFIYMLALTAVGVALLSNVIDVVFDLLLAPLACDQSTETKRASLSLEQNDNNSNEGGQVLPLTPRQSTQYVRKTSAGHGSSWTRSVSPAPSPTALHIPPPKRTVGNYGYCFDVYDELRELHERTDPLLTGLLHNADVLREYSGERHAAPTSATHKVTNKAKSDVNDTLSEPRQLDSAVEISAASPVQQLSLRIPGSPNRSPTNSPVGSAKRSRVVPAATQSDATLQDLMERVLAQRRLLPEYSAETRQFDEQWGISIAPEAGSNSPQSLQPTYSLSESAQSKLSTDMQSSDQRASLLRAQLVSASSLQAGVLLLQTFVLDLLGHRTTVGRIVSNRFQIELGLHAAVSAELKLFCALLVLAVNAAMVYYVFYISYQRQQMWQWCYLVAVGVQVLFDMCISETLQCIVHHYTIPSFVRNEIGRVMTVLHQLIMLVTSPYLPHDPRSALEGTNSNFYACNVTPFLFVSSKLAQTRPLLLESALVLSYATSDPGFWRTEDEFPAETKLLREYLAEWANEWYMQPQQYAGCFVLFCGVQTVRFLRHIGTLPKFMQIAIIHCLQVIFVCGLILFALAASKSLAALIILVVLAALVCSALFWRQYYVRARAPLSDNIKVVPVDGECVSSAADKSLPNQSFEPDGAFAVGQDEEQKADALETDHQESELDEIPAVNAVLPFADDLVDENDVKQNVEGSETGEETQETIWNFRSFWEGAEDENVLSAEENNDDVEIFEPLEEEPVVVQVGIKPKTQRVIGELVSSAVSEAVYQVDLLAATAPAETVFDSRLQETICELVSDAVNDATTHIEGIVQAAPENEPQQLTLDLESTAGELAEQAMISAAAHVEGLVQAAPLKSAGDVDKSAVLMNQTTVANDRAKVRDPISNPARVAMQKAIANYAVKQPTHNQEAPSAEPTIVSRAELEPVAVPMKASAVAASVLAPQHVPVALQEYLSSPKVNPVERDTKLALAEYFGMMWSDPSAMSPIAAGVEPDRVDQSAVDNVTRRRETLSLDLQNSAPTVSAKEGFVGALSPSGVVATFPAGDLASDTSAPTGETVVPAPGMLSAEAAQELQNTVQRQAEELAEANRVKAALEARLDETRQLLQMFAAGRDVPLGTALSPGTSSPAAASASGQETMKSDKTEVQHPEVTQLNENNVEPERADTPTKSAKPAKSTYVAVDAPVEADLALQLPVFSRNFAKPSAVSRSKEESGENSSDHMIVPIVTAANAQKSKEDGDNQKDAASEDTAVEGSPLPSEEAVTVAEARVASSLLAASLVQDSILGASEKVAEIVSDSVKRRKKSNAARAAKAAVGDIVQQGSSKVATARLGAAKVKSEKANRKASVRKTDTTAPRVRKSHVVDAASSAVESVLAQGSSKVLTAMAAGATTTKGTRKSTVRKNDKERQRAERAAAQAALIDSYEVTSSIFSSDGEGSGSNTGSYSRSRSSSGSSSGSSNSGSSSGSYSGSNSGSYSGSYSGSSASGDYKSYHNRDEGRSSKKYGHFTARNVDTYDPTSSIFSSDEEEL